MNLISGALVVALMAFIGAELHTGKRREGETRKERRGRLFLEFVAAFIVFGGLMLFAFAWEGIMKALGLYRSE